MYIVLLSFLLLLTGCSISQKEPLKSTLTLPKTYTQPQNIHVNHKWWEEFNDLQLNNLIEIALTNNRNLKIALQNLKASAALVKVSASSQAVLLDGTASATRNLQNSSSHKNLFSLGLAASYEVDVWGRLEAQERASQFDYEASQEDLHVIAISISAEVAITYYQLLEQHQQLALLQKQLTINKKYLELLISKFNISHVKAADILQQRQALEALNGERERTLTLFSKYQTLLALLLGTDRSNIDLNLEKTFTTVLSAYSIKTTNLLERPDVKAAYLRVQASSERVSSAISNSYPRLSLGATLSTTSANAEDLFKNWFATLAANLTAPLVDGGRRKAEVEQQEAKSYAALYAYEHTLLKALKEVQDAQSSLWHQKRYLSSIKTQQKLSQESSLRIRQQYIYGNGDYLRLLTAQLNHEKLQRSYLTAHRELIEKNIALHRAVAFGEIR